MSNLRGLQSFVGMLQGLLGKLMSGQMIFFAMVRGGSAVRMGREFVELRSSLVRIVRHVRFCPRPRKS